MLITANTPFAYNQDHLRLGVLDVESYKRDEERAERIERAYNNVLMLIESYGVRAKQDRVGTLGGFTAALMAYAWSKALRCMQTYKENHEGLTEHTKRFWQHYTYEDILGKALDMSQDQNYAYGGYIGSLAGYFVSSPYLNTRDPVQALNDLLETFWSESNIQGNTPFEKQQSILDFFQFPWELILNLKSVLYKIVDTPNLKRLGVGREHIDYLPLRIVLGEVDSYLLKVIKELLPNLGVPYQIIEQGMYRSLSIGQSAGFSLAYQALYLDALMSIINLLYQYIDYFNYPMTEIYRDDYFSYLRFDIGQCYREMADAYEILSLIPLFKETKEEAKQYAEQAEIWVNGVDFKNDRRLINGPTWLFTK